MIKMFMCLVGLAAIAAAAPIQDSHPILVGPCGAQWVEFVNDMVPDPPSQHCSAIEAREGGPKPFRHHTTVPTTAHIGPPPHQYPPAYVFTREVRDMAHYTPTTVEPSTSFVTSTLTVIAETPEPTTVTETALETFILTPTDNPLPPPATTALPTTSAGRYIEVHNAATHQGKPRALADYTTTTVDPSTTSVTSTLTIIAETPKPTTVTDTTSTTFTLTPTNNPLPPTFTLIPTDNPLPPAPVPITTYTEGGEIIT
ncbi:MAG: hypothetical protein Q9179_005298, partial [Wetmoreana sp. 5 TL-2023]